jgi:DNA-binding XRE family transcriptional regulator
MALPLLCSDCRESVTMTVTVPQLRAARSMLGWTRSRLALAAGVHRQSIGDIELGRVAPQGGTKQRLVAALEKGGVVFAENGMVGIKADILEFSEATSKGGDT